MAATVLPIRACRRTETVRHTRLHSSLMKITRMPMCPLKTETPTVTIHPTGISIRTPTAIRAVIIRIPTIIIRIIIIQITAACSDREHRCCHRAACSDKECRCCFRMAAYNGYQGSYHSNTNNYNSNNYNPNNGYNNQYPYYGRNAYQIPVVVSVWLPILISGAVVVLIWLPILISGAAVVSVWLPNGSFHRQRTIR